MAVRRKSEMPLDSNGPVTAIHAVWFVARRNLRVKSPSWIDSYALRKRSRLFLAKPKMTIEIEDDDTQSFVFYNTIVRSCVPHSLSLFSICIVKYHNDHPRRHHPPEFRICH